MAARRYVCPRLPKHELHRRCCRGLAGRRRETLDAHLVEKQILPYHEIQSHSIRYRRHDRLQIAVVPRSIERSQTFRDFPPVQRFAGFCRDSGGGVGQNLAIFFDDADRHDLRVFPLNSWRGSVLRRLRVR